MFSSLLGSLTSVVSGAATPADSPVERTSSSADPSFAPSPTVTLKSPSPSDSSHPSPPPSSSPPSSSSVDLEDLALDNDPRFQSSGYLQRLMKRGGHHPNRIRAIKKAALKDLPPVEPRPEECCGGGCGIECVVTIWWEEEKTWRDMHRDDWKDIKRRLKEEEEDRKRAEEEDAALNGSGGEPQVAVGIEIEGEEGKVKELEGRVEGLSVA